MELITFLKTHTKINNNFIDDFFSLYNSKDKYNFSIRYCTCRPQNKRKPVCESVRLNNYKYEVTNLFDEKSLNDVLYTRNTSSYNGSSLGLNLVESEYEFYKRLLVNLSFIFKSKGTRSSIEFFLKFLGAPEPLIKIDEYVYQVTSFPNSFDLEQDIYDVISGEKKYYVAEFNPTTYSYTKSETNGITNFSRYGYPVDENTGLPRRAFSESDDIFFEKGSVKAPVKLSPLFLFLLEFAYVIALPRSEAG